MWGKTAFLTIMILSSYQTQALKYEELAGFEDLLKKEFKIPLNPLCGVGFLRWGQRILQNIYTYGQGPLADTVRELFHHVDENENLIPTENEAKTAFGIGPYEAGWLLALILTNPGVFKDPTPYKNNDQERIKTTTTTNTQSCAPDTKQKRLSDVVNFIRQVDQTHKKLVKERHPERKAKNIKGTSTTKLFALGNNASKACEDTKTGLYGIDFIALLFNAYACAKSKEKMDIIRFIYDGFVGHMPQNLLNLPQQNSNKNIPELVRSCAGTVLTKYGKKILEKKKDVDEKTELKEFLSKNYSPDELSLIPQKFEEELPYEIGTMNAFFFPGLAYILSLSPLPENISQVRINKHSASDCTEASFLYLLSGILYHNKEGKFTVKHLSKEAQNAPDLKFIIEFLKTRNPNNSVKRTWWFEFLGNRSGVEYKQKNLEVRASVKNIFTLFNHIFGTKATSWEDLGKQLSSDEAIFTITGPKIEDPQTINSVDKFDPILLKKKFSDGTEYEYEVNITHHQHAEIIERMGSGSPEQRKTIVTSLMTKGLPFALYASLLPLKDEIFSAMTRPLKDRNEKQFFLTLSKDLKSRSFFELYRLASAEHKVGQMINVSAIKPNSELFFTDEIANWLIQKESIYKDKTFQPFIKKQANTFALAAIFYQRIEPIIELLQNIKKDSEISTYNPSGEDISNFILSKKEIEKIIKGIWVDLLRYWYDNPDSHKIMDFLLKNFPHSYCENAKIYSLNDPKIRLGAIKKFIEQDIRDGNKGKNFTLEHPHMLLRLIDASLLLIQNQDVWSTTKNILKGGLRYFEIPIINNKNIMEFLRDEQKNSTLINKPKYPLSKLFVVSSYLHGLQLKMKKEARTTAIVPYGSIQNQYQNLLTPKKPIKKKSNSFNTLSKYKIHPEFPSSDSSSSENEEEL